MGTYTNLHIGPYLVVTGERKIPTTIIVWTCSNKNCEAYKSNRPYNTDKQKFCADCGNPIKEKEYGGNIIEEARSIPYEDEFENELVYTDPILGNMEVFIANAYSPFDGDRKKIKNGGAFEISGINFQEEMNWFTERYSKIIKRIQDEYGMEAAKVKWGVVQYYS